MLEKEKQNTSQQSTSDTVSESESPDASVDTKGTNNEPIQQPAPNQRLER